MAVTRQARSITMTATGDADTGTYFVREIQFQGSGLTAGQRLRILDTSGSVIADYLTEAAIDNAQLLMNKAIFRGLRIEAGTVAGTWVVTFMLE